MNDALPRVRLYLVGGAAMIFLGGLLVAIGRWNGAETDRAFVEAAALAARSPPPAGGMRYWAPTEGSLPGPAARAAIEATERLRQAPSLPIRPLQLPRSAPLPAEKPQAAPQ